MRTHSLRASSRMISLELICSRRRAHTLPPLRYCVLCYTLLQSVVHWVWVLAKNPASRGKRSASRSAIEIRPVKRPEIPTKSRPPLIEDADKISEEQCDRASLSGGCLNSDWGNLWSEEVRVRGLGLEELSLGGTKEDPLQLHEQQKEEPPGLYCH